MIQIPTNARQQQAYDYAHQLRREAFAALFRAVMKKAGPRQGTGPEFPRPRALREVLRPVGGDG